MMDAERLARAIHARKGERHGDYTAKCICNFDAEAILRGAAKMVPPLNVEKIIGEWESHPRPPETPGLRAAALEWRDAEDAYWSEVNRGPVAPPDQPNFEPWRRWRAAQSALRAALAARPPEPSDLDAHEHEWVDARNYVVKSGELCPGCGATRAAVSP